MEREGKSRLTMVFGRFGGFDVSFTGIVGKHIPIKSAEILGPACRNNGLLAAGIELVEEEVFFVCEVVEVVFILDFEISALGLSEQCRTFNVARAV